MKKNLFLVFFVILFSACGGGGGTATSSTTTKTAYFYDSAVNGLEYKCGSKISGITGDAGNIGSFRYQDDCLVEFAIGKIYLGNLEGNQISSGNKIYPTTILGLASSAIDERVENMLVLLQTLDSDNNASNGINISSTTRNALKTSLNISNMDFTTSSNISLSDINSTIKSIDSTKVLVDIEEALLHFQQTLNNNGYPIANLVNPTPYLIDYSGKLINLASIKTRGTTTKDIIIKGESGTKIYLASNNTGITPALSDFNDTNKTIGSDRKGYLTLDVNDDNKTNFYYFINLVENTNNSYTDINSSKTLDLNISRDFIPPHIASTNIIETMLEEQIFFRNINSTDAGIIKVHKIVEMDEDNRSTDAGLFKIDENGTVTFKVAPNFDKNINAIFNVIARAVDYVGNMTDVFLQIHLLNILDNPPAVKSNTYSVSILEGLPNGTQVFDLNSSVDDNLTNAPDNDPALSPKYFNLYNHTDIFKIDRNTGIISIKDANNTFFDFEKSSNTIDLNVSVENNNTRITPTGDLNITYLKVTVNILNKIDTTPKLITPTPISIDEKSASYTSNFPIGGILVDTALSDKNTTMVFSITNGNDGNFTIDQNTGIIYTTASNHLDFETRPQYNLTIRATNTWTDDNSTHYDEVIQTINLNNKVDNPPVIVLKTLTNSIPESTTYGITVATFDTNGTIADANATTSYTIVSTLKNGVDINTSTPFTINSSGIVTTSRQLLNDYIEAISNLTDTVFRVTIKARNQWWDGSYNDSNSISFDVNVSNVIDNPPTLSTSSATVAIDENATVGTSIYDIDTNGTTYDSNNTTSFSIVSGDTSKFDINSSTGVITLKNTLDWETTTTYILGVKATNTYWDNSTHDSATKSITINVNNIIEKAPSITGPTTLNIHENIDVGEVIATIETNSTKLDEQTIDSITIVSGDSATPNNKFKIDINTDSNGLKYGELKIANKLDYETNSSYDLNITATNSFGSTTPYTIHINVIDDVEKDLPLLIVMVQYNDINLTSTTSDVYNDIFSTPTPEFGTINDYFYRVSNHKFNFSKATENYLTGDGIIVVDLNKTHPKNDINILNDDLRQALIEANTSINFASFDKNSDGNISKDELQILFMVAGGEITYGDTNQSIKATTGSFSTPLVLNGKVVASSFGNGNYVVVGERNGLNKASIGLIAQHLGHSALNFPYLNDTTNASYGIGFFGLMGYGYKGFETNGTIGSKPVNPSAYNILSQGWVYPKTIKKTTPNIGIVSSNKGTDGFNIIKIPTNDSKIYYLLENRVLTNSTGYDVGFYGMENQPFNGGLALWKINESKSNNDDVNNKLVDIIEYDGDTGLDSSRTHFGKSSSLYHVGNPSYSTISTFSISNSSLEANTNKMTIDISFP